MHIFRQEIWCIENGGADSILRMEVLTIRDVFILNFAPVSLSVSPPGPCEFVMYFNSRRQIIAVLVRLRHKIWVACKAKSAPLPKNWLEASTARGTLFTSSPRSQHSGIVRKQQVFSSSESALAIGGMLQMSVHSWSILSEREAYDMYPERKSPLKSHSKWPQEQGIRLFILLDFLKSDSTALAKTEPGRLWMQLCSWGTLIRRSPRCCRIWSAVEGQF